MVQLKFLIDSLVGGGRGGPAKCGGGGDLKCWWRLWKMLVSAYPKQN